MKSLALISALFLADPAIDTQAKQSLKPNLQLTSTTCGQQPATPPGCVADSAKCVNGSWQWTC